LLETGPTEILAVSAKKSFFFKGLLIELIHRYQIGKQKQTVRTTTTATANPRRNLSIVVRLRVILKRSKLSASDVSVPESNPEYKLGIAGGLSSRSRIAGGITVFPVVGESNVGS
jgi:hypothetical protein